MIKITRHIHLALLLVTGMVTPAHADEAPRQFDIELLIFQNLSADDGGEVWPVDYTGWFNEDTIGSDEPEAGITPRVGRDPDSPAWLTAENLHLQAEQVALERSGNYRPLRHIAWRQSVLDRNQAQAIEISPDDNQDPVKIEGTVRVAVERYLHLYLDLKLVDSTLAFKTDFYDYDLPEFRLKEHRRMRSKELHYFDHPKFGVIALITPYTPPEPQPEATVQPVSNTPSTQGQ